MKKLLIILGVLALLFFGFVFFVGGSILNKGIQTVVVSYGPGMTGTNIELAEVKISPLSGSGIISGLVIGNPVGFTTEKAFSVTTMELKLVPGSLLGDTIEIERILIDAPEIILERANGTTNLQQIQDNIAKATAGTGETPAEEAPPGEAGEPIKLSIKEFVLSNAVVSVAVLGQNQTVNLPTIRLTDLGTAKGGVPPDEIAQEVMKAIIGSVSEAVTQIGMEALKSPDGINNLKDKATSILGGFLNKKEAPKTEE